MTTPTWTPVPINPETWTDVHQRRLALAVRQVAPDPPGDGSSNTLDFSKPRNSGRGLWLGLY